MKTFASHFDSKSKGLDYGLLRGKVTMFGTEDGTAAPHFQLIVKDSTQIWRIAINVRSDDGSNDQAAVVDPLIDHPILAKLDAVNVGFTSLNHMVPGLALDFVREPIFEKQMLKTLPPLGSPDQAGIEDILEDLSQQAIQTSDASAEVFVWGSRFIVGTKPREADIKFGNKVGIHDVHMNQGNPAPHEGDNGVYQDGGLIFHFVNPNRFVGIFMKFESQVGKDDQGNVVIP